MLRRAHGGYVSNYYDKDCACDQVAFVVTSQWRSHVASVFLVYLVVHKTAMQDKCFGCSCETSGLHSRRLLTHIRSAWHDTVIKSLPEESSGYQIE